MTPEERKKKKIKKFLLGILGLALFFTAWEVAVDTGIMSHRTMATPIEVAKLFCVKMYEIHPEGSTLPQHFLSSLKISLIGFFLADIIGIPMGIFMGYFKGANRFLTPIFEILRPIPPIAWIPVVILCLGIGTPAKAFIIFVAAFVPNVINSSLGITLTSKVLINSARTAGATDWQVFTKVCIPSAMNMIFTGVRLALNQSWATLVAAEMLAATRGLGYMIQMGRTLINPALILVGMLTIGMSGSLFGWLLGLLEKKVAPWRYV